MAESMLISVRVSKDTAKRLESLAQSTDRSKSYIASQAIEEYLHLHEWQIKAIEEGIKDVEEGQVVSHGKVKEWLQSWGTDNEKDAPKCS
ncbi:MAG: CopG family transcriptional regulator [bacterium]|nr:MAG: CopG family transcriptional regulator [bacterium]